MRTQKGISYQSTQATEVRAVFRRLTRVEYPNAIRDLLELPQFDVQSLLPADGSMHGFDKRRPARTGPDSGQIGQTRRRRAGTHSPFGAKPDVPAQIVSRRWCTVSPPEAFLGSIHAKGGGIQGPPPFGFSLTTPERLRESLNPLLG